MKYKWGKWTEERIQKFIAMYPSADWDELSNEFESPKSSLITIASQLGVKRQNCNMSNYTEHEDNIIKDMFNNGNTINEIQLQLPWRTIRSIRNRVRKICTLKRLKWTNEENTCLTSLYSIMPINELIEYFPNRTRDAIIIHAGKLGLKAYAEHPDYSEYENHFIKNHYLTMNDEEMGGILGRSKQSVKNHRNEMGLHRVEKENIAYENTSIYVRRHIQKWKKDSMEKCGFKCIIIGERFDEIHHLVSLNTILEAVYNRLGLDVKTFDINILTEDERYKFLNEVNLEQSKYPLGVCLRRDIHMQFHNYYGYGNNTIEQFYEFIEKNYPNIKINLE